MSQLVNQLSVSGGPGGLGGAGGPGGPGEDAGYGSGAYSPMHGPAINGGHYAGHNGTPLTGQNGGL